MTVREEEDILGKTPDRRILLNKLVVFQLGIQRVSLNKVEVRFQRSSVYHRRTEQDWKSMASYGVGHLFGT
jgi:hypothetical protein